MLALFPLLLSVAQYSGSVPEPDPFPKESIEDIEADARAAAEATARLIHERVLRDQARIDLCRTSTSVPNDRRYPENVLEHVRRTPSLGDPFEVLALCQAYLSGVNDQMQRQRDELERRLNSE